jgi:DNA-binding ferritin-like protein
MECLSHLLAVLRAAGISHQHAHWTVKGTPFYGDHLMFERIYNIIPGQVDHLAEKAVQKFGPKVVDPCQQLEQMSGCMEVWDKEPDLYKRGLLVEKSVQASIKHAVAELDKSKDLDFGLDNFLRQLADDHQTPQYLLTQRTR